MSQRAVPTKFPSKLQIQVS